MIKEIKQFYKGKTVLVTGHTGFKGSWLTLWLLEMGANVIGISKDIPSEKGIFKLANIRKRIIDYSADLMDFADIDLIFEEHKPDMVFHLAAQALVRTSYDYPHLTFNSNLMGTVTILDCMRDYSTKVGVMITTDKVYENKEWIYGYRENDRLGGHDPYSASKACAELAISCYQKSFNLNVASARAGNVIGGGDWAKDRIITDIMESIENNKPIGIRNPLATRPWQFVLEPLYGYLILGKKLYDSEDHKESYNFGPDNDMTINVVKFTEMIIEEMGEGSYAITGNPDDKKETNFLALGCSKAKKQLGWKPTLTPEETIKMTVEWYKDYKTKDVYELCKKQIKEFERKTNDV